MDYASRVGGIVGRTDDLLAKPTCSGLLARLDGRPHVRQVTLVE
jgi:hypothetical protein